jgi:hypothetical protein
MTVYDDCRSSAKFGALSNEHRRVLVEGSAIAPDVLEARGVRTITRPRDLPDGYNDRQRRRVPGMLFPIFRPNGQRATVFRPDKTYPDKPGWKFEQIRRDAGGGNTLDVHPFCQQWIEDTSAPLVFTEGIKKADSLTAAFRKAGIPAVVVGVVGVWNWLSGGEPIADMLDIPMQGRGVTIMFDSDLLYKWQIQLAAQRLAEHVRGRGGDVFITYLRDLKDGSKCGVDDHFAGGGSISELRLMTRRYRPEDFERIRLSRSERLRAAVEDLSHRFWTAETWVGMGGHTDRDVYLCLIRAARRHGTLHADGLRVSMAHGRLALEAKVSTRSVWKSLKRLEARGVLYRDQSERKPDKAGAFVLRAGVSHYRTKVSLQDNVTHTLQSSYAGDLHLRAPRLRWSQAAWRQPAKQRKEQLKRYRKGQAPAPPEPRPRIRRPGKTRGAFLDALDAAGGTLTVEELCGVLGRKRPRDLVRRKRTPKGRDGLLIWWIDTGVVRISGDVLTLASDWQELVEEQRRLGQEIDHESTHTDEHGEEHTTTVQGADSVAAGRYKAKQAGYRDFLKRRNGHVRASKNNGTPDGRENVANSRRARAEHFRNGPDEAFRKRLRVEQLIMQGMSPRWAHAEVYDPHGDRLGFG